MVFSTRALNQLSRPWLNVKPRKAATITAGANAAKLNSVTKRKCKRAPVASARQARAMRTRRCARMPASPAHITSAATSIQVMAAFDWPASPCPVSNPSVAPRVISAAMPKPMKKVIALRLCGRSLRTPASGRSLITVCCTIEPGVSLLRLGNRGVEPGTRPSQSPRPVRMPSVWIFLRSVLRLIPSTAAARIWLPRVACSVWAISGRSTSAKSRS